MGTWIEYRCENSNDESSRGMGINVGDRCLSHDNAGPMGMSSDNMASVTQMIQDLSKEAKRDGWVKTRAGWICPFCVKARANLQKTPE